MENSLELTRSRWIKDHKPTFHQPGDYMPDFLKPRPEVVDLDTARETAATAARGAKPKPVPPPEVLNKKWETLAAMRKARAQAAKKRKQA